ncbi:hypothetical protein J1N35_037556, partial [Gossypium stocksii]
MNVFEERGNDTCMDGVKFIKLHSPKLPIFKFGKSLHLQHLFRWDPDISGDTCTGTIEVHSSSLSGPNSKLPISRENSIEILIEFLTRTRPKKFKEAMMGLIHQVWVEHEMSSPYWTKNNVLSPYN